MKSVRILVADDHEVVRRGVCSLLESRPGWTVVGEAITGRDAVKKAEKLKPDVVILDISVKTAETHRRNVLSKLNLHSISDLIHYAIRNKIIEA
jgi:DNA-binding NarL/FixJ family response regulator